MTNNITHARSKNVRTNLFVVIVVLSAAQFFLASFCSNPLLSVPMITMASAASSTNKEDENDATTKTTEEELHQIDSLDGIDNTDTVDSTDADTDTGDVMIEFDIDPTLVMIDVYWLGKDDNEVLVGEAGEGKTVLVNTLYGHAFRFRDKKNNNNILFPDYIILQENGPKQNYIIKEELSHFFSLDETDTDSPISHADTPESPDVEGAVEIRFDIDPTLVMIDVYWLGGEDDDNEVHVGVVGEGKTLTVNTLYGHTFSFRDEQNNNNILYPDYTIQEENGPKQIHTIKEELSQIDSLDGTDTKSPISDAEATESTDAKGAAVIQFDIDPALVMIDVYWLGKDDNEVHVGVVGEDGILAVNTQYGHSFRFRDKQNNNNVAFPDYTIRQENGPEQTHTINRELSDTKSSISDADTPKIPDVKGDVEIQFDIDPTLVMIDVYWLGGKDDDNEVHVGVVGEGKTLTVNTLYGHTFSFRDEQNNNNILYPDYTIQEENGPKQTYLIKEELSPIDSLDGTDTNSPVSYAETTESTDAEGAAVIIFDIDPTLVMIDVYWLGMDDNEVNVGEVREDKRLKVDTFYGHRFRFRDTQNNTNTLFPDYTIQRENGPTQIYIIKSDNDGNGDDADKSYATPLYNNDENNREL